MKLRIRGDSLRLRLTRSEVDAIGAAHSVSETMHLPDGSELGYTLAVGHSNNIDMRHEQGRVELLVTVETVQADRWATSEQVAYGGERPMQIGPVSVLIEKDFTCITPRSGEEESDTFPNPQAAS